MEPKEPGTEAAEPAQTHSLYDSPSAAATGPHGKASEPLRGDYGNFELENFHSRGSH